MTAPRLDHQLCFQLYTASRLVIRAYQPVLDAIGLTYAQYLCMLVLWERADEKLPAMSVKDLGSTLYLDSGTLTPLLKRLVDKGLVTRARSEADGRVVLVTLTDTGRALAGQANKVPYELLCQFGDADISPEKAMRLMGLRDQVNELVEVLLTAD